LGFALAARAMHLRLMANGDEKMDTAREEEGR
jgi:hypothetical protein